MSYLFKKVSEVPLTSSNTFVFKKKIHDEKVMMKTSRYGSKYKAHKV